MGPYSVSLVTLSAGSYDPSYSSALCPAAPHGTPLPLPHECIGGSENFSGVLTSLPQAVPLPHGCLLHCSPSSCQCEEPLLIFPSLTNNVAPSWSVPTPASSALQMVVSGLELVMPDCEVLRSP
jgi:hypothetical protein